MADTNKPGCARADEKRERAGSRRKHVTSRVGTAATVCSAVFCGCAATVFLWTIPAAGGSGPAMVSDQAGQQAVGGGAGATSPPGGTVRYLLHVDAPARHTVVRASAVPAGIAVQLTCPDGAEGPVCRLSTAGPVDIPASVYVPVRFAPGTVIRITEVASAKSGVTVQDMVIHVVPAPGTAADPAPSSRAHPRPLQTPPRPGQTRSSQPPPGLGHTPQPGAKPTTKPSPRQSTPDPSQPAHTATPAPAPGHNSAPASVPGLGSSTPAVSPSGRTAPTPAPSPTPTPTPSPGTAPAPGLGSPVPTPKPTHSTTPTTKPTHSDPATPTYSDTPTAKPAHRTTPTAKPTHRTTSTPRPSHDRTTPPAARARHSPEPVRSSHPAIAGFGHAAAPPGGGRGAPVSGGRGSLPLPLVSPADSALAAGNGQANAGAVNLPPADQPVPESAPILPSGRLSPRVQQPSPLPLPRVTQSATDPAAQPSQGVVLPNRAGTASNDRSSTMSLVEAQIIGLSIALGGALAALLRPVRNRSGQRPERPTDHPGGGAHRPPSLPFRTLQWLRPDKR